MKKIILTLIFTSTILITLAQSFAEIGKLYPLNADGNKYNINGFVAFEGASDEDILVKSVLWAVENISPKLQENITAINYDSKDFKCVLQLASMADSGLANIYSCNATFRVADGKLLYYISDISVTSENVLFKKTTAFEALSPQKNERHVQTMDDFVNVSSLCLNKMFDFVINCNPQPITHWSDIKIKRIVKGMNADECYLAQGKPVTKIESGGEIQWMYTSSFYLFFKNDEVVTVIK